MPKFLKDTPVHLACPACGKVQRAKLKWLKNHKSLNCKDCRKSIDLKEKKAKNLIARTAMAVESFERALKALHAEAKKAGKSKKTDKKKAKKSAKPAKRATARKRPVPKSKPASMLPASGLPAGGQPSP